VIRVGLTGNIASGKSTLAAVWERAGVPVLSADELSRRAVAVGGAAEEEVREVFGEQAFQPDGALDRDRMRALVVRDPEVRKRLENLLHPHIRALRETWLTAKHEEGAPLVVNEVPLLFEVGMEEEFDVIVVVDAPEAERVKRLETARRIPSQEAQRILAVQGDAGEKKERADHVILNGGTVEELEDSALALLHTLLAECQGEGTE